MVRDEKGPDVRSGLALPVSEGEVHGYVRIGGAPQLLGQRRALVGEIKLLRDYNNLCTVLRTKTPRSTQ